MGFFTSVQNVPNEWIKKSVDIERIELLKRIQHFWTFAWETNNLLRFSLKWLKLQRKLQQELNLNGNYSETSADFSARMISNSVAIDSIDRTEMIVMFTFDYELTKPSWEFNNRHSPCAHILVGCCIKESQFIFIDTKGHWPQYINKRRCKFFFELIQFWRNAPWKVRRTKKKLNDVKIWRLPFDWIWSMTHFHINQKVTAAWWQSAVIPAR